MPQVTLEVPVVHRAELRHLLLGLYGSTAETLADAATAYVTDRGSVQRVLADEAELTTLRELVDQLGWRLDLPVLADTVKGESGVLTEVARAILKNAIEGLRDGFEEATPRADEIVAFVPPALTRVRSAFALLQHTYDAARVPQETA